MSKISYYLDAEQFGIKCNSDLMHSKILFEIDLEIFL